MLNQKLKALTKFINKEDIVIDVACDHAYLAIYLKENNLCEEVYASDISKEALKNAQKNIQASKVSIKTYHADGLKNIPLKENNINTVVIAGVGTNTALNIVKNADYPISKYIISSNNNHEELRKTMQELNYYNEEEIVIKDHHKFYPIIKFIKSSKKDNNFNLKYGKSSNIDYYHYLLTKEENIIKNIPEQNTEEQAKHQKEITNLKKIIKERS